MAVLSPIEKRKGKGKAIHTAIIAFLIIDIPIQIFPFIWAILTAFKDNLTAIQTPPVIIPDPWVLEGFKMAFTQVKIQNNLLNTFIICGGVILLQVTTSALAAYSLSKLRPKFGGGVLLFFLGTMMISSQALIFPTYLLMGKLHLVNNRWSVILAFSAWSYVLYMFKTFFDGIPSELIDAASIDGASKMGIFLRIMLPLSKPVFAVNILNTFMAVYNQFVFPLVLLPEPKGWTAMIRVYAAQNSPIVTVNTIMALLIIVTIPIMILFLFCQKYIVEGISMDGIKE